MCISCDNEKVIELFKNRNIFVTGLHVLVLGHSVNFLCLCLASFVLVQSLFAPMAAIFRSSTYFIPHSSFIG